MTRYLLMKIESWEGFDTAPGPFQHLPIQVRPPAGCVGFCMVFDSREAALQAGRSGRFWRDI